MMSGCWSSIVRSVDIDSGIVGVDVYLESSWIECPCPWWLFHIGLGSPFSPTMDRDLVSLEMMWARELMVCTRPSVDHCGCFECVDSEWYAHC